MLDLDTVSRRANKMPVDFATYLLSSSPPATNLELISYAFSDEARQDWERAQAENNCNNNNLDNDLENINKDLNKINIQNGHTKHRTLRFNGLKPIIIRKDELNSDGELSDTSSSPNSGRVTPTSPCSPRSNKKVSFADHRGYALATVRIMTEASDQPPKLKEDVLQVITKGATASVSSLPPFKLTFVQPASDYMAFRDKIDKCNVSLENVILRDYNVLGTIKVKNICFDKRVFLRLTKDNWCSSQDIEAKYVQPFGGNLVHNFDTFSFEFDIDPQKDANRPLLFAVCYEAGSSQFWDNNSGANYEIVPTDFNADVQPEAPLPTSTVPTLNRRGSLTDYGCWHHVDTSAPYY